MEYQAPLNDESETEVDGTGINDADTGPEKKEKIQEIIETAGGGISLLFHTPDDVAYADILVAGHRETWKIRSTAFKKFFRRECWQNGIVLKTEELRETINLLEARAQFDGPEINVYLRVAAVDDEIWIDRCDRNWAAVRVTPDGWNVMTFPDVRFHREPGMDALPEPERGGTVEALRRFLNVRTEEDFLLVVAFVLGALSGRGPFPVLVLIGEQGTAKSTLVRMIRGLIDPSSVPLLAPPATNRDLFIAARNSFLLGL
jgi:hypothetical protein